MDLLQPLIFIAIRVKLHLLKIKLRVIFEEVTYGTGRG
jgi:hypothetical protein